MARPSAGLQPSTGPRLSSGSPECQWWDCGHRRGLAKPVMALLSVIFQGSRQAAPVPLWHASARQGFRAKPGNAPLACQCSTGGGRLKPAGAPLAGQRLTVGSHHAWRCPSGRPALDRGGTPSPAMPLWRASTWGVMGCRLLPQWRRRAATGVGLAGPQAIWPLSLGESLHTEWRLEFSAKFLHRGGVSCFQLVWHAASRCHGIMVTTAFRQQMSYNYGTYITGTYITAHFWKFTKYRYCRYLVPPGCPRCS